MNPWKGVCMIGVSLWSRKGQLHRRGTRSVPQGLGLRKALCLVNALRSPSWNSSYLDKGLTFLFCTGCYKLCSQSWVLGVACVSFTDFEAMLRAQNESYGDFVDPRWGSKILYSHAPSPQSNCKTHPWISAMNTYTAVVRIIIPLAQKQKAIWLQEFLAMCLYPWVIYMKPMNTSFFLRELINF